MEPKIPSEITAWQVERSQSRPVTVKMCNGKMWQVYYVDRNGLRQGEYKLYDLQRPGTVQLHCFYKDNETDGKMLVYNNDGSLKMDMIFSDGKRHGSFRWFHTQGTLLTEGLYVEGKMHGEKKTYNITGELIDHRIFEMGVVKRDFLEEKRKAEEAERKKKRKESQETE